MEELFFPSIGSEFLNVVWKNFMLQWLNNFELFTWRRHGRTAHNVVTTETH